MISDFFKYIADYFRKQRKNVTVRQTTSREQPRDSDNPPPGYIPIETYYDLRRIPDTSLDVGIIAKVLQSPVGEIITANLNKGVRCGCGHHIYLIDMVVTPESIHRGLGGHCPICASKAMDLYNKNKISLQQAEASSLYCSLCASTCDICDGNNFCVRHTSKFNALDGSVLYLCPECLEKAKNDKFFKEAIAIMLLPFVDYRRLPPSKRKDSYDNY
jgi:hypothetical protein